MRVINSSHNAEVIQGAIDLLNQQIHLFESDKVRQYLKKDSPLNI